MLRHQKIAIFFEPLPTALLTVIILKSTIVPCLEDCHHSEFHHSLLIKNRWRKLHIHYTNKSVILLCRHSFFFRIFIFDAMTTSHGYLLNLTQFFLSILTPDDGHYPKFDHRLLFWWRSSPWIWYTVPTWWRNMFMIPNNNNENKLINRNKSINNNDDNTNSDDDEDYNDNNSNSDTKMIII